MEITVRRGDLAKELQLVQGIVERKNSIPILSNVLAEASDGELRVCATDLDVSLRCGCEAQVKKPGSIALGAKKLYEIVRALPEGEVKIRAAADSWATIESQAVRFKVAGLPGEDFPTLPKAGDAEQVSVPGAVLRGLIERTSFAITAEDARYYLAGALLILSSDGVSMVATDGHRLSYARAPQALKCDEEIRVLVPRKAINELAKLLETGEDAGFQQVESHLVFKVGGRTLASKTIEGQFPAFEKVITISGDKTLKVGCEQLATAVRRVSLLSAERSRAVKISLSADTLELAASSPDLGEARESLAVEFSGEALEIGFNAQYLLDFLGAAGSEKVMLEFKDAESQGIFRPERGEQEGQIDYRYVVMPMRL